MAKKRVPWPAKEPLTQLLITECGIELFDRYTLEEVVILRYGPTGKDYQPLTESWVHRAPPASTVAGVEVYYQLAWYKRELLVITDKPTCSKCRRKYVEPV